MKNQTNQKKKQQNSLTAPDKETLFRQKAEKYLCCFNDHCPRHEQCLRWEVGQYYDPKKRIANCVSPRYSKAADGTCDNFRNNEPHTMPLGMKHRFYYDMPERISKQVKRALIDHYYRSLYYEYHRGDRPIPPEVVATIESICSQAGWTAPLQFDGEVTDYAW